MFIHRVLGVPTSHGVQQLTNVLPVARRCSHKILIAFLSRIPIRPGSLLNNDERFFDDPRDITQENAVNINLS
jgi:hypothetical protein